MRDTLPAPPSSAKRHVHPEQPATGATLIPSLTLTLTLALGLGLLLLAGSVLLPSHARAAKVTPITTLDTPVARQLEEWNQRGTAAGNTGDLYENRDGNHSGFPIQQYPQLTRLTNPPPATPGARSSAWGACWTVRTQAVLVGNSSTASLATHVGSNPRQLYGYRHGLQTLHAQYRANNLFLYPEHQDHDPGRTGRDGGFGDLLPANTPYLIISQGSSYTDQPFLQAVFSTLAAFQPATKQALIRHGLLMPTVQMLLRLAATNVAGDTNRYLSGPAHPTVFRGEALDPLAMIRRAHAIEPNLLPPLPQLRVLAEVPGTANPALPTGEFPEALADTPGAIARIWRSPVQTRTMILSAEDSLDANGLPLTYHWRLLRGDPERVSIRALNDAGSRVEITLRWSGRRPIRPGDPLESTRTDIGLFVHNGTHWSPPAFVTWLTSPRELRSADDRDRPIDLSHQAAHLELTPGPLTPILESLQAVPRPASAILLRALAGDAPIDALLAEDPSIRSTEEAVMIVRTELASALDELTSLTNNPAATPKSIAAATNRVARLRTRAAAAATTAGLALRALTDPLAAAITHGLHDPGLVRRLQPALDDLAAHAPADAVARVDAAARRVAELGINPASSRWTFQPPPDGRPWTAAETNAFLQFHVVLFQEWLAPTGWSARLEPAFAIAEQFPAIPWRDVYRHDPDGRLLGWERHGDGPARSYDAQGLRILERDDLGRPALVLKPQYRRNGAFLVETNLPARYAYRYQNAGDREGRLVPARP